MDILYLLDQLEEVLSSGSRLPFTDRTLIDEQECLDILDQIRVAIPEEMKAARRISQERDQLLAEAQAQADRMLQDTNQEIASRVTEHSLVRAAESRAQEIEDHALEAAEDVRREAEEYAARVLKRLQAHVRQIEQAVDSGLKELASEPPEDEASA